MAHTILHNPATGAQWACPDKAVDAYLARGWVREDSPTTPKPPADPPEEPSNSKTVKRGHSDSEES